MNEKPCAKCNERPRVTKSYCRPCRNEYNNKYYAKNRERRRAQIQRCTDVRRDRNRQNMLAYRKDHPCTVCGEDDPRVLEFHHRDPAQKSFVISRALDYSWDTWLSDGSIQ